MRMPANRGHFVMLLLQPLLFPLSRCYCRSVCARVSVSVNKISIVQRKCYLKAYENFNVNYYHCNMALCDCVTV